MHGRPRVFVIGLDCAAPHLVFDRWADRLPNLTRLRERGIWGNLESTVPPITVPAWACMMSGKDPGTLGIYGFRNRTGYGYDDLAVANSLHVTEPRLWQILSRNRKASVLIGVPQTYPVRPLNGVMVSCFLAPDKTVPYTYPAGIAAELDRIAEGDYLIDVRDFRTDDKDRLLESIHTMTRRRFLVVRGFIKSKPWDFFMFVEMGVDRIHHGFWRYSAPDHRLYQPGHRYEHAIRDYYACLDEEIGETLDLLGPDTTVLVVSDHGARTMVGGISINEWLIREGEMVLTGYPAARQRLSTDMIDWSATRAWGEGGYYARIFLNVRDREPQGIIAPEDYERVRDTLARRIAAIPGPNGEDLGTRVIKPEEAYRAVNGIAPDLIVYFGDLSWRSAGSVGTGRLHVFENDTGPDDANHDPQGMWILAGPAVPERGRGARVDASIYDVAPTVLSLFDLPVPADMIGRSVVGSGSMAFR